MGKQIEPENGYLDPDPSGNAGDEIDQGRVNKSAAIFLLTCTVLLTTVFVISGHRPNYYNDNPVDFAVMSEHQYAVTTGLDDTGIPLIKQSYFENSSPPRIGVYGHHVIENLGRQAFPFEADNSFFFNYYVPHISLREIADFLSYQEKKEKLPTNLAIIYISHPYLGLRNLTENRWNMPIDFYRNFVFKADILLLDRIKFLWSGYVSRLQFRLDWKHLSYGLFNIVSGDSCKKYGIRKIGAVPQLIAMPAWLDGLSNLGLEVIVRKFEAVFSRDCGIGSSQRIEGLKRDGSFYSNYEKKSTPTDAALPSLRIEGVKDNTIFFLDEAEAINVGNSTDIWTSEVVKSLHNIAKKIHKISERNDLDIVFFIPPRLAHYIPHAGHKHIDRAVSLMREDGMIVLDTRQLFTPSIYSISKNEDTDTFRKKINDLTVSGKMGSRYMLDEEHVNDRYFKLIIDELDSRGYLPRPKKLERNERLQVF